MAQAEAEGWVHGRNMASTVIVTVGCLAVNAEASLGPMANEWIRMLRRLIYML